MSSNSSTAKKKKKERKKRPVRVTEPLTATRQLEEKCHPMVEGRKAREHMFDVRNIFKYCGVMRQATQLRSQQGRHNLLL
jgi:hypothetical protein